MGLKAVTDITDALKSALQSICFHLHVGKTEPHTLTAPLAHGNMSMRG